MVASIFLCCRYRSGRRRWCHEASSQNIARFNPQSVLGTLFPNRLAQPRGTLQCLPMAVRPEGDVETRQIRKHWERGDREGERQEDEGTDEETFVVWYSLG